jgi:hypothetical protein
MTFVEAAFEVLRWEGRPLHYKELTERALGKKLLTFVGRTPEVTMQTQLTAAVKKAPGNPFVRVKPGVFGLLRYPEISAEERAAATAKAEESTARPRGGDGESTPSGEGGRRRRRRGSGRGREERPERPERRAPAAAAEGAASGAPDDGEIEEPDHGGLSAEARAAALAETGVLEAEDETAGDEEIPRAMDSMEDEAAPGAAPLEASEGPSDEELEAEGEGQSEGEQAEGEEGDEEGEGEEQGGEPGAGELEAPGEGQRAAESEPGMGGRRRRRRRRRGGRGGESETFGEAPRMGEGLAPAGGSPTGSAGLPPGLEAGAFGGESAASPSAPADAASAASSSGDNGQGPRRIMTPVDAAIEILRGQAPGRGVHVRQIADGASRRRLVHGEPNEAWRVMRTALAAEPRERLRAGQRPRLRSAGAGLFSLARRPPEAELERAEQVFGEARRALRERTVASLERRLADLPAPAFEALARVLLQREGFGPATFVKRVEGTVYVEALRGRGGRPSRCLVGFRFGGATAARGAILELRYGIRARGQDEGLLMLAGRLSEEAIAAWKQPGPPIEIADGAAMAETCIRHGVGVINTMVSVDFVDADFFAEIAEG